MAYTLPYPVEADGTVASGANVTANFTALINAVNSIAGGGAGGPAVVNQASSRSAITSVASPTLGMLRYLTETGREGPFMFNSANLSGMITADPDQAIYLAPSSGSGIATDGTAGAWVRVFMGPINFLWGGAKCDDNGPGSPGTDCYQRLINMLGLILKRANVNGIYALGETLYFPRNGNAGYFCNYTGGVNIRCNMRFLGEWEPVPNVTPQGMRFPLNSAGFIINRHNTTGYTPGAVAATTAADGFIFDHFAAYSGAGNQFGGGVGFDRTGNYDGVLVRARCTFIGATFLGFARNNVYVAGSSDLGGSGLLGNANCTAAYDCCFRYAGRHNIALKGTDSNACHFQGGYSDYALGFAVLDESAIGTNTFDNIHTEFNGLGDGTTTFLGGTCAYPTISSQRYAVAYGQEALASTQAPGTGTAWINMGAGVTGGPLWVSGMTWYAGGCIALRPVAGVSRASNYYIESGQAPPQNNNHGHMEDGMATGWNPGNTGTGQTTIAPSGGPSVRVDLNPSQVAHTANDGAVIEHNIGDGSSGGDARLRSFRNSTMTSSHYVYERVKGTDLIGYEWNLQRLFWFTGANPLNITITQAGRPAAVPYMFMPWLLKIQAYDNANEGRIQHCGLAAPTTGTFAQGEYVRNMAPAVGSPKGWFCTVGGTPGTWVSEGNL